MFQDLTSLRLFVRAAESGKLGDAARQSNLAVAAASRRITLLEDRFGVRLFYRSRHGVRLTPAGEALLISARVLLDQARAIDGEMADYAGGLKGQIRLQANTSAITQFLPADLAAFAAQAPDIRVDIEEAWSAEIVAAVQADRADLGVIVEGTAAKGLATYPYRTDRLALLAPHGVFPPGEAEARFVDYLNHDFVGLLEATAITRSMHAEAAAIDLALRLRVQVRSFDGVCRMVEAGFGLGVLPEGAARRFAATMEVEFRILSDDWATRRMLVCLSPSARQAGLVRTLTDHLVIRAAASTLAEVRPAS